MTSKVTSDQKPVGVIGAGSFGSSVANLLAENNKVILYARNPDVVEEINHKHQSGKFSFDRKIVATNDLQTIARECDLLFPVIPSSNFRSLMQQVYPSFTPTI